MIRRLRREQSGFTLVEMLVAVSVGSVIVLAALAILDLGVRQSGKVFDREDSVQNARTAMYTIAQELRSQICLDASTPPIVAGGPYPSGPYTVSFYTYTGSATGSSVAPELHTISWDTNTQTITERDWTGAPPDQNTTPARTRTLLTNVVPTSANAPIFSYWGFATAADGSVSTTSALPATLGAADIKNVARVSIAFKTYPQRTNGASSTASTVLTQDVLSRNADPNDPDGANAVECVTS